MSSRDGGQLCSIRKVLIGRLMSHYETRPPGFFHLTDQHRQTGLAAYPTMCQLIRLHKRWAAACGKGGGLGSWHVARRNLFLDPFLKKKKMTLQTLWSEANHPAKVVLEVSLFQLYFWWPGETEFFFPPLPSTTEGTTRAEAAEEAAGTADGAAQHGGPAQTHQGAAQRGAGAPGGVALGYLQWCHHWR